MSKHTPGPWTAHQGFANGGPVDGHPNWCEVVSEFDDVFNRFSCSGHFGIANARLIAAAPELLAALQNLIEAADSMRATFGCIRGDTPEDSDTFIHDEWAEGFLQERADAARAAIAAATGEQA